MSLTPFQRINLIEQYTEKLIDQMTMRDMHDYIKADLENYYDDFGDNDLIEQIQVDYPELLQENNISADNT